MFRFLLVRFSYVRVFHSICFSFPLFDFLVYLPAASSMQSESSVRSERWLTKKDVLKTDEKRKGKRKEKKLFVFLFPSCAPPAAKPNLTAALASLAGRQSSVFVGSRFLESFVASLAGRMRRTSFKSQACCASDEIQACNQQHQ